MCKSARTARRGFTLVEVLVVVGIIATLIAILLPALSRARMQARRTQDLSNIKQMAVAAINYAAMAHGAYPIGTKGDGGQEDLAWTNNTTADYLIQFCNTNTNVWTDLANNPSLGRVLCCNAEFDNAKGFNLLTTGYYSSNEDQLGWVYWGGRYYNNWTMYAPGATGVTNFAPYVMNTDGTTGPTYVLPLKQGDRPTTRTLFTCFSYMSTAYGGLIPHQVNGNGIASTVNAPSPYRYMKLIDGMCMAYIDGSARYVPQGDIGAVAAGSWYFYDKTAAN
jgi:prepilin-type N-terminal cleavage/methylation domain-containing protein